MPGRNARLDNLFESPAMRYRVLGLAAALAFVLGTMAEESYSSRSSVDWVLLIGLVFGFLMVSAVSFQRRVSLVELENGWFAVLLLAVMWQTVHNYEQNLSFEVALQNFVHLTAASATLRRRYQLRVFLGLSLLNVLSVSFALPNPEVSASLFATQIAAYCTFMYFIISSSLGAR
jgi:hypothetical protein